jgi:hypothetical protein
VFSFRLDTHGALHQTKAATSDDESPIGLPLRCIEILRRVQPRDTLPLKVTHQGNENVVADGATALIGSDASSTIRIVRPGISRRHVVLSHDGSGWKVQDAGSRNGTFKDGQRIQTAAIDGPTTLYLGHPTDGEAVALMPVTPAPIAESEPEAFDLPATPPPAATKVQPMATPPPKPKKQTAPTRATSKPPSPTPAVAASPRATPSTSFGTTTDVEIAQLTAAIRDQISAVKGLTWSVWAMIAVTAALIVLTLFVGILSN